MRNAVLGVIVLFSFPLFAGQSLVLVTDPGNAKTDFPVLEIIDDHCLILAEQRHIDLLQSRNFTYKILDADLSGKHYYLVYPFENTPDQSVAYDPSVFEKYGTVLATFEKCLLLQTTDAKLQSITEYTFQLDYIELEPIDVNFRGMDSMALSRKPVEYDPVIEKMLGMVSPDSVEALERKLCAFHTRHAKSTASKNEVMPWFKTIFKVYGCDTVIELPMSDYSPAVFGVRFGTKDSTIKKFTLLGGHNDNIIHGASADARHEGANDNATGSVAVLEACRVHQHFTFDYTIIYCAFNAEELGFHGSNAIMKYLKENECKAIGGCFSYDMFGMSKSNMSFSAYTGVAGCDEFVDQMKAVKELYHLTQPVTITTTNNGSPSTDSRMIWKYGYQGITHNFATAGAGTIHQPADVLKTSYDKAFQAECAKLGIATTAEQAVPKEIVSGIAGRTAASHPAMFSCMQTGDRIVISFREKATMARGALAVYNLQGKLLATMPIENGAKKITWHPAAMAKNSVLLFNYSAAAGASMMKPVMK